MLPARKAAVVPENLEAKKLRKAFDEILQLKSGNGLVVWGYLHHVLGWNAPTIRISRATGDLAPLSTEAAAALRDTYLEMRRIPTRELVVKAEELAETLPPAKTAEEK